VLLAEQIVVASHGGSLSRGDGRISRGARRDRFTATNAGAYSPRPGGHSHNLRRVSPGELIHVPVPGGTLACWTRGSGERVLVLHGGPGFSCGYLDPLVEELAAEFRVAVYQQRGLEPSTLEGPFTVAQAVQDAVAVMDGLQWERALVVGHSWGGQLALRLAGANPERLAGVLAVDPLGIVEDGGRAAFEAEIVARTPKANRERLKELDDRAMEGPGTTEEALESLSLLWPAYFADPENAPPLPPTQISVDAYSGIMAEVTGDTDVAAAELVRGGVRYGVLAGAGSPMPWGLAARASAELSPDAFLTVIPHAGHFPWVEAPGCVAAALRRLQTA
jgi:pimeloyl-ACP methyl ester carboxylesterase